MRRNDPFLRNLLTSWSARVLSLLATFALVPILVHGLGTVQYGLWAVGFTLLSFFSLTDVGVNAGLVKLVADARAKGDTRAIAAYLSSSLVFYGVLGIALVLLVALLRSRLASMLGVPVTLQPIAGVVFLGMTASLVINNLAGIWLAILNGFEWVHVTSWLSCGAALATALSQALLVRLFHLGLAALTIDSICIALLSAATAALLARRLPVALPPVSWRSVLGTLRAILRFSVGVQISNIAGVVNSSVDKFILSAVVGLASAGLYDLGSRLAVIIWTFCWIVSGAAFPTATRLGVESPAAFARFYRRAERYLLVTACGLGGVLFVIAPTLVTAWLGQGYEQVVMIVRVLAVAGAGVSITNIAVVALWSQGRTREVVVFSTWRLTMHVVLSLVLAHRFGLHGALVSAFISLTVPSLWFLAAAHRHIGLSNREWLRLDALPVAVAVALAAGAGLAALRVAQSISDIVVGAAWVVSVLVTLAFGSTYLVALWRLHAFAAEDLAAITSRLAILRQRVAPAVTDGHS